MISNSYNTVILIEIVRFGFGLLSFVLCGIRCNLGDVGSFICFPFTLCLFGVMYVNTFVGFIEGVQSDSFPFKSLRYCPLFSCLQLV